jgi:hypothetical protein
LRNFELEYLAALEVPTSCLPSWSNWLTNVDELVDDLHKWRDLRGARLMDLLKNLAVPETFLVAVDNLVVLNADAGVTVLEEPVGVVL